MKLVFVLLLNAFLAVPISVQAPVASSVCFPISGADQIWSQRSLHWVFVGEMHGSNETPSAFRELVCDALNHGKGVTVALERPSAEQSALDGILTSHNLASAKSVLLQQPGWREQWDGRSSEAMLRLLVSLRELHASHPDLSVFAFDAPYARKTAGSRDAALGAALLSLGKAEPHSLILILTGNAHAMTAPQFKYKTAAMFIPAAERLSLEVTDRGGESWNLMDDGCGTYKGGVGDKGAGRPRGIFLDPRLAPFGRVDGVLSLGVQLTASSPAAGDVQPVPACRAQYLSQHTGISAPK